MSTPPGGAEESVESTVTYLQGGATRTFLFYRFLRSSKKIIFENNFVLLRLFVSNTFVLLSGGKQPFVTV